MILFLIWFGSTPERFQLIHDLTSAVTWTIDRAKSAELWGQAIFEMYNMSQMAKDLSPL